MCIKLRKAQISDIEEIYKIEKESFKDPWSKKAFLAEISLPNELGIFYVAEEESHIKGYIIMRVYDEGLHILNIAVSKDARKKGIGTTLLKKAEEVAALKNISLLLLEVRVGNIPAINLYKKLGYKVFKILKNYYSNNEDAYLMIKTIK